MPLATKVAYATNHAQRKSMYSRRQIRVLKRVAETQHQLWYRPLIRRGREPIGKRLLAPSLEDSRERAAKPCGIHRQELLCQNNINEVLGATAQATLSVSSCVRVNLQ